MVLESRLKLLLALSSTFVAALIVGDLVGGKLVQITAFDIPFVISVGMIPFPVTFVLTDLLNEFYGKRVARHITFIGFFMAAFSLAVVLISVSLPIAPFTRDPGWSGVTQQAFGNVLAGSTRILVASMCAYLASQLVDISVFHALKRRTQSRHLWLRATGSTLVSQLIDTVVIQFLAWYGLLPMDRIVSILLTSYAVKMVVAVGLTPVIYAGHALLERRLGLHPVPYQEDDARPVPAIGSV
jgi:uncharacterized integral membrane protein (TIGR00697 family)